MIVAVVTPGAYVGALAVFALVCVGLCIGARRRRGPWVGVAAVALGLLLLGDALSFVVSSVLAGSFSAATSLPLALCDMAVVVAALACILRVRVLVELTYFVGLAGTLQAVITPDLSAGFPHLVFFEYVVGHCAIVTAALFLVFGLGIHPGPGAVGRCFLICAAYTALVGAVDAATSANYMFLRRPPGNWTLLRLLGPWPYYVLSAAGVALVLFVLLDLPFRKSRRAGAPHRADPPPHTRRAVSSHGG